MQLQTRLDMLLSDFLAIIIAITESNTSEFPGVDRGTSSSGELYVGPNILSMDIFSELKTPMCWTDITELNTTATQLLAR